MLEFLTEDGSNILGIRATGKLNDEDYRNVLAPRVQSLLKQFHTLRVLFIMDETFQGWSLKAAWANTTFNFKRRRNFEKIAMVGGPKWEEWCVRIPARLLMKGELQTFRPDQLHQAREWLRA